MKDATKNMPSHETSQQKKKKGDVKDNNDLQQECRKHISLKDRRIVDCIGYGHNK